MEFVPTSHSNQALVYNGYIFHLKKTNKNGSLIWRCQQYHPKVGEVKCSISCTTIWNGSSNTFIRYPPLVHNHEAPTKGKKLSMEFVDRVATEVPKSTQPLRKIWEKSQGKIFTRDVFRR